MAKPGDPFETKALDDRRSEQRRLVRELPTWVVDEVTEDRRPLDTDYHQVRRYDRRLCEELIREEATARLVGEFEDVVNQLRAAHRSEEAADVVIRRVPVNRWLDGVARELRDRAQAARAARATVPLGMRADLSALLELLVLADELADDDYHDPRRPLGEG